jgi:hypothetical protein
MIASDLIAENKQLREQLKNAVNKLMSMPLKDAQRYQWLRAEFAAGRETYIGENMVMNNELAIDKYIDEQMAREKNAV